MMLPITSFSSSTTTASSSSTIAITSFYARTIRRTIKRW
jgi:hypothetical protein